MEVGITPAEKESLHLKISCTLLPMELTIYALKKQRFTAKIALSSIHGYVLPYDNADSSSRANTVPFDWGVGWP